MDIDIARIEQQTRLVDRRPRFHARQRHQRHAGAQRQQEQPHTGAVVRRLRPDGALATVGAGGGAAASGEGQRRRMAHRRPAAQERRSTAKASAPPSTGLAPPLFGAPDHRHRELIPPFGYRRDVLKANVVAVFERLAQFRNTLRDDVAGHNVPGPDVFDKLVPAKHFPGWRAKRPEDRLNAVQG